MFLRVESSDFLLNLKENNLSYLTRYIIAPWNSLTTRMLTKEDSWKRLRFLTISYKIKWIWNRNSRNSVKILKVVRHDECSLNSTIHGVASLDINHPCQLETPEQKPERYYQIILIISIKGLKRPENISSKDGKYIYIYIQSLNCQVDEFKENYSIDYSSKW